MEAYYSQMMNVTYKDTIPFVPPITKGKVVRVYDGDTINIASKLPWDESPLYRFSVRVAGIDCPELKTRNDNEKLCAKMARDLVSKYALNKIVFLENVRLEKYGRILADVRVDGVLLKTYLLDANLAVEYHGKTRNTPKDWLAFYNEKKMDKNVIIKQEPVGFGEADIPGEVVEVEPPVKNNETVVLA